MQVPPKKYCVFHLIASNKSETELHMTPVLHLNVHYIIAELGHTKNKTKKNKMPGGLQCLIFNFFSNCCILIDLVLYNRGN